MKEVGRKVREWESSNLSVLPCKWCQGDGLYRTYDVLAACLKCNRCRECGRDRNDQCAECLQWDEENRDEAGKVALDGVRKRWMYGN